MRRSILSGFGVAAIFIIAACSPDQATRGPLAPTVPSLAQGSQCSGPFASQLSKDIKDLFPNDPDAQADLGGQLAVIKNLCPNAFPQLMTYLQSVVDYGAPTTDEDYAEDLVGHWSDMVNYVTGETQTWEPAVLVGDAAAGGVPDGGAKVLFPGDEMTTFDGQAGLSLPLNPISPTLFPILFTFEPVDDSECDAGTAQRITGKCYDVSDYPDGGTYSPPTTVTLCLPPTAEAKGIGHEKSGYGTEVAQPPTNGGLSLVCSDDIATSLNSWLGRNGGPLGRVLARAYDYLRPRPLFATHGGTSGWVPSWSLVGGILNDIFRDDFDLGDSASFNDGVDTPDLGDGNWIYNAPSPGYIRIQDALGNMSGGVVVLSQAQGACNNCPVFRLLGTRINAADNETIGSYDIFWTALQNKPNVKEAPFAVFRGTPNNNNSNNTEIARLSYVTESSQNKLLFKVLTDTGLATFDVGSWTQNDSARFNIRVNLTTQDTASSQRVWLYINGQLKVDSVRAVRATALRHLGYILTGIDAGIVASDNWLMTRRPDIPPQ